MKLGKVPLSVKFINIFCSSKLSVDSSLSFSPVCAPCGRTLVKIYSLSFCTFVNALISPPNKVIFEVEYPQSTVSVLFFSFVTVKIPFHSQCTCKFMQKTLNRCHIETPVLLFNILFSALRILSFTFERFV